MIIYNVTLKVDLDILEDWKRWLLDEHIPAMMATGLFQKYSVALLLEQDDTQGRTFVVKYFCESIEKYNTYIRKHAQIMRNEGFERYGDKVVSFRTLMEEIAAG